MGEKYREERVWERFGRESVWSVEFSCWIRGLGFVFFLFGFNEKKNAENEDLDLGEGGSRSFFLSLDTKFSGIAN